MAPLPDDIYALQDLAGWARRHGIHQVRSALKHCLTAADDAPDNVALAESMEHALVVDADETSDNPEGGDAGSGEGQQGEEQQPGTGTGASMPPPTEELPAPPGPTPHTKSKRATFPKGHEKAGQFVPDDPSTPENESIAQQGS